MTYHNSEDKSVSVYKAYRVWTMTTNNDSRPLPLNVLLQNELEGDFLLSCRSSIVLYVFSSKLCFCRAIEVLYTERRTSRGDDIGGGMWRHFPILPQMPLAEVNTSCKGKVNSIFPFTTYWT